MKKMIILLALAGMAWIAIPQTKIAAEIKNVQPTSSTNETKENTMKDYVFILRLKGLTPEILAQVGPQWAKIMPKWISEGHFVGNSLMNNEGQLFSGKDRVVSHAPARSDGEIVLDVFRMKAENLEQALELARLCPTLDAGGSVEVREIIPIPAPEH
jgi:hypothetical protein